MKHLLTFIIFTLLPTVCFSELDPNAVVLHDGIDIPIYEEPFVTSLPETAKDTIYEILDTDTFYYVRVTEVSPLRVKIIAEPVWGKDEPQVIGWVDKQYIGLYPLSGSVRLYNSPKLSDEYLSFYAIDDGIIREQGIDNYRFILLDFADNGFRKVMFTSNGVHHVGWINKYCRSPYQCN